MSANSHQPISGFTVNMGFNSYYILSSVSQRTTQAGKPYLSGILSDASGRIPFVMWDNTLALTDSDVGKIVYVEGEVQEYRNALQARVNTISLTTDANSYQLSDLIPYAPIDVEAAVLEMGQMLYKLSDPVYSLITQLLFLEFRGVLEVTPAAKSIHHAFVGGWAMHTWKMMCLAEAVYQQYCEVIPIDHDLLIAGTFLHDIGKFQEFDLTEQNLVKDYSEDGRLLSHSILGVMKVEETAQNYLATIDSMKVKLLEHIIASHHGSPEYGAAVYPQTVEAEIVHQLDSLDSRIEIFREELNRTPIGQFSGFNRALERCVFHYAEKGGSFKNSN